MQDDTMQAREARFHKLIVGTGTTPVTTQTTIADAGFKGTDTLTDADASLGATTQAELEGVLQDFGDKINLIIDRLQAFGLIA